MAGYTYSLQVIGPTVLCRPLVLTPTEKVSVATECLYAYRPANSRRWK